MDLAGLQREIDAVIGAEIAEQLGDADRLEKRRTMCARGRLCVHFGNTQRVNQPEQILCRTRLQAKPIRAGMHTADAPARLSLRWGLLALPTGIEPVFQP